MVNKSAKPAIIGRDDWNIQFDHHGRLKHFLTIEGLGSEMLTKILDTAESFASVNDQHVKKVPLLRGKTIVNLFFEASTRTRTTFELAAKRLSADVLNINISTSADRRFAASSKVVRVRVLDSKNRLTMVLPRSSGTFFTC